MEAKTESYDTIFFANNNVKSLLLEGSRAIQNGIVIETKDNSESVWLDSIKYSNGKSFLIASTPEAQTMMLYFDRDTSIIEKVAINKPSIEEFKLPSSTVVLVTDSSFNSGYLIKSMLFYQVDDQGKLKDKREYFPLKKASEKQFDFTVIPKMVKDTLFLYKNDKVDYRYF